MMLRRFLLGSKQADVYYVVDESGWVQEKRLEYLRRHMPFSFEILTVDQFCRAWKWGFLRHSHIYFASWRIVNRLQRSRRLRFAEKDFTRFMTSITSHYDIGGGLNPVMTIPKGRDYDEVFAEAVEVLRNFKVVTANSRILHDLLVPKVDKILYAPNGVDTDFFNPANNKEYDPNAIRIGWVGKVKGAKNYEVVEEVMGELTMLGLEPRIIAHDKNVSKDKILSSQAMVEFYHEIDYYLCTSWHEGTPNPALEAAACGVPLVSTRVGNMPDLIRDGENGFLVQPNVQAIVETFKKIRRLDCAVYAEMCECIRKDIVDEWTWERNMTNYRSAFDRLLA